MARYDDIDTKFVAYATVVSCLLLVAILQGTQALCYYFVGLEDQRKIDGYEYVSSNKVIREQIESLSGYQEVDVPPAMGPDGKPVSDKPTKRLQIPIEKAQQLLLKEAQSKSAGPKT
jgi:hypothetical protein